MCKRHIFSLLAIFLVAMFLSACATLTTENETGDNNNNKINESNGAANESQKNYHNNLNKNNDKTDNKRIEEKSKNHSKKPDADLVQDDKMNTESKDLSKFSAEEIEYARVWLQIVGNTKTKELNVYHTSAGEQVNPYDDDSVNYAEDVITLGGKIMADGIVTYSGNGDGTINLYDVPSHWPSYQQIDESMEQYTKAIIENTKLIQIEPNSSEEVIRLIERITIDK